MIKAVSLLALFFLASCAPRLVIGTSEFKDLKRARAANFKDMGDRDSLRQSCLREIETVDKILARKDISSEKRSYYEEIGLAARTLLAGLEMPDLDRYVSENFDFYRAGKEGSVLFTGYYSPLLSASRTRDERYAYPVYGIPEDLIKVDLEKFGKTGKIKGRVSGRELVPYMTREEIDKNGLPAEAIVYVDNKVDLFFLHIQGSGLAELREGGRIRLNYADSNGHGYKGIGRLLIQDGMISQESMSMDAIKDYFSKNPANMDQYLNQNPSYVFFKEDTGGPFGSTGTTVTPLRSIAADGSIFPKMGLAYIVTEIPDKKSESGSILKAPVSTLAFDHDSGGAIKGPGRIDIYFGEGGDAAFRAGHMKFNGTLYYLKPKKKIVSLHNRVSDEK